MGANFGIGTLRFVTIAQIAARRHDPADQRAFSLGLDQ